MSGYAVSAPMGFGFDFNSPDDPEPTCSSSPGELSTNSSTRTLKKGEKPAKPKPRFFKKFLRFGTKGSSSAKPSSQMLNEEIPPDSNGEQSPTRSHYSKQASSSDASIAHTNPRAHHSSTTIDYDGDPFFGSLSPEIQAVCSSVLIMMEEVSVFERNPPRPSSSRPPDGGDNSLDFDTSDSLEDTPMR